MKDDPVLLYTVADGIASITLNRPTKLNAFTREMLLLLRDALDDAAKRKDIKVIAITGAGRAFCAGQDLGERDPRKLNDPLDLERIQKEIFHPVVLCMTQMQKPVVACVNGIAAGAGSSIALAADIVIAKDTAVFAQSFVKVGLSVDAGGGLQLVRALGPARTRALLMLGGNLTADEAAKSGLIWKSVKPTDFQTECQAVLKQLVQAPSTALACIKAAVSEASASVDMDTYLNAEAKLQGIAGQNQDYTEGVLAFLEKRKAMFE
ncbi:MAG: enoyl-CoA hydratase-related protein [Amylibacter sp.]